MGLAQHEYRFEQAGFTRAVGPCNQVGVGIEIERRTAQVPEICQAELTDCHTIALRQLCLQPHRHDDIKATVILAIANNCAAV